jgi:thiosulfate/3-mercaptopyruvate sulfurtransferase
MQRHPYYPATRVCKEQIPALCADGSRLVQVDLDLDAYNQGHISGAISWNWNTHLRDPKTKDILDERGFELLLGSNGISRDTPVILYGDNNNWFACWAFWMMRHYGHENVRLLDGGLRAWLSSGLPLSSDVPSFAAVSYIASVPDSTDRAQVEDVFGAIFDPESFCLIDTRSSAEFEGEIMSPGVGTEATCATAGHIPSAINMPWNLNCNFDGTFKAPDELRLLYEGCGVVPDKAIITYCAIGERASLSWFVLKHLLGYPVVMNYDRSMAEWSRIANTPIERSAA